jgi:hypothetical protein
MLAETLIGFPKTHENLKIINSFKIVSMAEN